MAELDPNLVYNFQQQRNNYASNHMAGSAELAQRQGLGELGYQNTLRQMNTQYDRQRGTLPSPFLAKHMYRSGMYNRAKNEFNTDKMNAFGQQAQQFAQQRQGWGAEQTGLNMTRDTGYLTVEGQAAMARAQAASQIAAS